MAGQRGEWEIGPSSDLDLEIIYRWLTEEHSRLRPEERSESFLNNWHNIRRGHDQRELTVLRESDEVVSFYVGRPGRIDLFNTHPRRRREGLGRILVDHFLQETRKAGVAVVRGECAPPSSFSFWQRMGYERVVSNSSHLYVFRLVSRDLDGPEGNPVDVVVEVYSPDSARGLIDESKPERTFTVDGVIHRSGSTILRRSVPVCSRFDGLSADAYVRVLVDSKEVLPRTKVKALAAKEFGFEMDSEGNYYIEQF